MYVSPNFDIYGRFGDLELKDELKAINLRFGANTSEDLIGTNAVALSVKQSASVWTIGRQNYAQALHPYAFYAFTVKGKYNRYVHILLVTRKENLSPATVCLFRLIEATETVYSSGVLTADHWAKEGLIRTEYGSVRTENILIILGSSGQVTYVNDIFYQLFSTNYNNVINYPLPDVVPELGYVIDSIYGKGIIPSPQVVTFSAIGATEYHVTCTYADGHSADKGFVITAQRMLSVAKSHVSAESGAKYTFDSLVGVSDNFCALKQFAERVAATNRPESLDPALTRPGRFDRRVPVELPDLQGREAILRVHAKKIKTEPNINYAQIARMASGASGAELANIVNEAALRAVRNHRTAASQADMEESIEVVIAGYQKKNAILTDKEKSIVSYHEIGHALVAALQSHSAPVQKITIVPRTSGALGYTMQVDEGNHYLMTKDEIINKIATLTAGRVAEEIVFGSITTGASNDIEQATKLARAMITRYGMSDEFGMVAMETVENAYLGGDTSLSCSAETQARIDALVVSIVKEQYQKATQILTENRAKLDELAKYLYEKETITGEEFMNILNKKEA